MLDCSLASQAPCAAGLCPCLGPKGLCFPGARAILHPAAAVFSSWPLFLETSALFSLLLYPPQSLSSFSYKTLPLAL